MTLLNHTTLRSGRSSPGIIAAAIDRTIGAIDIVLLWRERHRQRRSLGELSDHVLKDVGLSRADVDCETSKRFWHG